LKTRRKKIFFFVNYAPESCGPQQIRSLYLEKNRRRRIFLFFFFSRRRRLFWDLYSLEQNRRRRRIVAFFFFSRKEEEEYILIKSRKGVVPLVYHMKPKNSLLL